MDAFISILDDIFSINTDNISIEQMLARSIVVFFIGIALVRLGKKRFVSKMTAFDFILAIMIGSLLSRAITKEKYFFEILAASVLIILLHRLISFISMKSDKSSELFKGKERLLVSEGKIDHQVLHKVGLTEHDLIQALRLKTNSADISQVAEGRMERNGDISFVLQS